MTTSVTIVGSGPAGVATFGQGDPVSQIVTGALLFLLLVLALGPYGLWTLVDRWLEKTLGHKSLEGFGVGTLPRPIIAMLAGLWLLLFVTFTAGVLRTMRHIVTEDIAPGDFRWYLLTLTAATTALGAVVALPLTLVRTAYNARQTRATEASLANQKLSDAFDGLSARHTVLERGRTITFVHEGRNCSLWDTVDTEAVVPDEATEIKAGVWEHIARDVPDVVTRSTAIDRLYGLAKEQPFEIPRIASALALYVRDTTREDPPSVYSGTEKVSESSPSAERAFMDWLVSLRVERPDRELATQVLGKLQALLPEEAPPCVST